MSALDAAIRDELRTELRRLQRQLDLTVIYVTHDQAEAMALSDRIVVMEKGRVSQIGSPQDLYDRPATRFTASFIGVSNQRETTLERIDGHDSVAWGQARLPVAASHGARGPALRYSPSGAEAATLAEGGNGAAGTLHGQIESMTFLGADHPA